MSADEFFDKKELEKLPPSVRAEIIKKKQKELEERLNQEAEELEKETKSQIEKEKQELDQMLEEQEVLERKKREQETKSQLEKVVEKEKPKEQEKRIDYSFQNKTDSAYIPSQSDNTKNQYVSNSVLFENPLEAPKLNPDSIDSLYKRKKDYI